MGGGSVGTAVTGIDFEGSLVSVDAVSNTGIATIRVEGLSVKDEGSSVGTAGSITTINFVGVVSFCCCFWWHCNSYRCWWCF